MPDQMLLRLVADEAEEERFEGWVVLGVQLAKGVHQLVFHELGVVKVREGFYHEVHCIGLGLQVF